MISANATRRCDARNNFPDWPFANVYYCLCILAGYIGLLGSVILTLIPGSLRPHTGSGGLVEHLIAYFLAAVAWGLGCRTTRAVLLVGLVLTGGAAVLELLQHFSFLGDPLNF